jgi:mRNA interferase MazF
MDETNSNARTFRRGEIYDIGELETAGSEQHGNRPVLIVSCDSYNDNSPEVIILFITSRLDKRGSTYHINLPGIVGLAKKSMVLAEQIRTIDKSRLLEKRGQLDLATMNRVDRGLKKILDLRITKKGKELKEEEKRETMKNFELWKKTKKLEENVRRSDAARCASKGKVKGEFSDKNDGIYIR